MKVQKLWLPQASVAAMVTCVSPTGKVEPEGGWAVTETPGRIAEAMFDRLRQHFSAAQIVELTLRIALCGAYNRLAEALAIDSELEVAEPAPVAAK